jgi:aspartyl-tRNA(Asn)/glutamyl-tRNA(Gln) amidotransferase subunit A
MTSELFYKSARELAGLIRDKELSPVELVGAVLSRIEKSQPVLNAFITVCGERALVEARAAEQAVMDGKPLGPLHGLPLSVKDLVASEGVRTTYGSQIYRDNVPTRDAVSLQRLRAAGAILVGKTTSPEFGTSPLTRGPLFGQTHNAWNQGRTSGGSSGGAAVAVAAGLGPLAIATDGGGSTRIPAAANGVVGFKQSLGVVPHDSAQDQFGNISYITPTTRTVYDTAMMLSVMAGPDAADPNSIGRLPGDFLGSAAADGDLQGVRIGYRMRLGNDVVAGDVLDAVTSAALAFTKAGATVEPAEHPFSNIEPVFSTVLMAYRYAQHGKHLKEHRDIMCPTFVRQIENAPKISFEQIYAAILARTETFHSVQSWFEDFDVIAMPTISRGALPIDQDHFAPIEIDGKTVDVVRRAWYPYTSVFNLTGHPAVSLPCGFDRDGLPLAIQLVGRPGADAFLLKVAATFERLRPWAQKRPSLPMLD